MTKAYEGQWAKQSRSKTSPRLKNKSPPPRPDCYLVLPQPARDDLAPEPRERELHVLARRRLHGERAARVEALEAEPVLPV